MSLLRMKWLPKLAWGRMHWPMPTTFELRSHFVGQAKKGSGWPVWAGGCRGKATVGDAGMQGAKLLCFRNS